VAHCTRVLVPLEHLDKGICHFCRFGKSYKCLGDEDVIGCRCMVAGCTVALHKGKACTGVFKFPAVKSAHGAKSFESVLAVNAAFISAMVARNGADKFGLCYGCARFDNPGAYYANAYVDSKQARRGLKRKEAALLAQGEEAAPQAGSSEGAGDETGE